MSKGKLGISHIVLIFASFLSVFPLYYMVCGATNQSIDVVRGKLFPGTYLVENLSIDCQSESGAGNDQFISKCDSYDDYHIIGLFNCRLWI